MSLSVVQSIRAKYPTPLGSKHAAFLLETAGTLHLGLLRKSTGTVITLPDGVTVSQDIVMASDGRIWDILQDGEGAAVPTFNQGEPVDPARFYAVTSAPAPQPVPQPTPPPAVDLTPLIQRLDALNKDIAQLRADAESKFSEIDGKFSALPPPQILPTVAEGTIGIQAVLTGRTVKWGLK